MIQAFKVYDIKCCTIADPGLNYAEYMSSHVLPQQLRDYNLVTIYSLFIVGYMTMIKLAAMQYTTQLKQLGSKKTK